MSRELFGTDGVRGKAGEYPLDDETVLQIGKAIGSLFGQAGKTILVGQDPRESSPGLVKTLVEGLTSAGCQVKLIGVIPTPGVAYLTRTTDAAAGVMVTASHNPFQDNGIKVFKAGGEKLTDKEEAKLNATIKNGQLKVGQGSSEESPELVKQYEDFLVESAGEADLSGLKIVVDCANGAAYAIGPRVFERLGAEVKAISNQPDGKNINYYCGATNTKALQKEVNAGNFDLGVAVDGDADRLIIIDGQGREFGGDYILYTLAMQMQVPAVVSTIMSNYGLERSLANQKIKLHRTQVGDRYVLEELRNHKLKLGGEQSGHIIIYDKQPTGDALLAAVELLAGVKSSGKSLDQWRDDVEMLPQAVVNLRVEDKTQMDNPDIQKLIKTEAAHIGESGRLLVRASGTEPKIRIMVEGHGARAKAQSIADELAKVLK